MHSPSTDTAVSALDLRHTPLRERQAQTLGAFDALPVDGGFVMLCDRDPRSTLFLLQDERRGMFDWSPLQEGPDLWRIDLRRRCKDQDGRRRVSDCLQADHRRLDGLLDEALERARASDREAARLRFEEFAVGLRRHIRMEEEVLFPAFEEATGMTGIGPTQVMRLEHLRIRDLLDAIPLSLATVLGAGGFEECVRDLLALLGDHNDKEEGVLYPVTDRSFDPLFLDDLVRRMQAV